MRTIHWVALCLAELAVAAAPALAERGIVKGTNGLSYEGDVQENPTQIIIRRNKTTEVRLTRDEVASIQYLSSDAEEVKKRWSALNNGDVPGRVSLARFAFERGQYELARSITMEAIKIDPNSREAIDLDDVIRRQIVLEIRASRQREDSDQAKRSPYALPESYLSEQDINALRQSELQPRDDGRVRVRFDNDVRRRFVQQYQYNPATFAGFSAFEQAMTMIREGDAAIRRDVIILDDPMSIREFRGLQPRILAGCAGQTCHGSRLGGNFVLFSFIENDAATYTNFYLLTKYSRTSQQDKTGGDMFGNDGARRYMIDRQRPGESLLLQYSLPQTVADLPHPQIPTFRPMFTRPNEPVYGRIFDWIDRGLGRVAVRSDVAYVSPVEQLVQPSTQPAAAPTTRPRPVRSGVASPR